MNNVIVGFCHPDKIDADFTRSLITLCMTDPGNHLAGVLASESNSFLVAGRNELAQLFMNTGKEWFLMVDADMVLPVDLIPRLLKNARPDQIVSGLCFTSVALPVMFGFDGQRILEWERGSLVPVLATGGACLMIHRSVFERCPEPWFAMDASCHQMDQDQNFLRLAQLNGTKIVVDTSIPVPHIKRRWISEGDYQMPWDVPNTENKGEDR